MESYRIVINRQGDRGRFSVSGREKEIMEEKNLKEAIPLNKEEIEEVSGGKGG